MKFLLSAAGILIGVSMSILAYNVEVAPHRPRPCAPFIPLVGGPVLILASIIALFLA